MFRSRRIKASSKDPEDDNYERRFSKKSAAIGAVAALGLAGAIVYVKKKEYVHVSDKERAKKILQKEDPNIVIYDRRKSILRRIFSQ